MARISETGAGTNSTRRGSSVQASGQTPGHFGSLMRSCSFFRKNHHITPNTVIFRSPNFSCLRASLLVPRTPARHTYALCTRVQSSFNIFGRNSWYALYLTTASLTSIHRALSTAPLSTVEASKRLAAYTAVDKHILPEDKVGHNNWGALTMCDEQNHRRSSESVLVRAAHSPSHKPLTSARRLHSTIRRRAHSTTGRGT